MKEFYPWSTTVYEKSMKDYKAGRLSILDVQLSGGCNYACIYCDSPDRNIGSNINLNHLENLIKQEQGRYDWMFICGLGEPLYGENKDSFLRLLSICKDNEIKCSVFTNGSNVDELVLSYVQNEVLYPVIKIDTFSLDLAKELYGTSQAKQTLGTIETLLMIAHKQKKPCCNIGASIVPSTKNINEIPSIVKICIENDVFPLIGQLEYAGKAKDNYHELLLTKDQLYVLKNEVNNIVGTQYKVPICPSVIAGIHMSSNGFVTVDKRSGLSCGWFWLETPQTEKLCNVNTLSSLIEAETKILEYRKMIIADITVFCNKIEEHPFGGCGGNIKDLINEYVKMQNAILNTSKKVN